LGAAVILTLVEESVPELGWKLYLNMNSRIYLTVNALSIRFYTEFADNPV